MADEEQKRIFAKNLNWYLLTFNKTQKEVADAIDVSPQTFNTWCQGIALPRMGKVQRLADYFGIGKTDLIDEKSSDMLTPKDERDIAKDVDNIMKKLTSGEAGPASYDGQELDPEAAELFRDELEIALRRLKIINKEKYTNKRYKK
ncbi:XRE family transcriptional regulator [bacterium 1XD42-94]|jgi:transcriptional regulator with XRE-family HTH domain|nr:XRE family transcriptional regulator [bacterium 1XD42-76]NBK06612.1 XRE family transcriptional regulator [bacterium 1XD42-94]